MFLTTTTHSRGFCWFRQREAVKVYFAAVCVLLLCFCAPLPGNITVLTYVQQQQQEEEKKEEKEK